MWNFLFTLVAGCCLPVDVMIFYKEPFGPIWTLVIMVSAFVPYTIIIADAMFPVKRLFIKNKGMYIFNKGDQAVENFNLL